MTRDTWTTTIALMLMVIATAGCSKGGDSIALSPKGFYSTKTPYTPQQDPSSLEAVPDGFTAVFTQMVARHGARALTSASDLEYVEQQRAPRRAWLRTRDDDCAARAAQ